MQAAGMLSNPWPTILSSIIVAAVSVLATIAYSRWAESQRMRLDCFRQMCRYNVDHDEFLRAFNEAPILFAASPKVVAAHQRTLDKIIATNSVINDEMVDFLKAIAEDLKICGVSEQQLKSRFGGKSQ